MSDSSIALKPVIDEPSKPMPSSSAPSISLGVIAKLFRCPSMSVNQRSASSTPSSSIRRSTARRASSLEVARFLLSTCAIEPPPQKRKAPGAAGARGCVASENDRASLAQAHGAADGGAPAPDDVAEPLVQPLHRLVPALGPRVELADPVLGRPGDRRLLERLRDAAAAPGAPDRGEAVLRSAGPVGIEHQP